MSQQAAVTDHTAAPFSNLVKGLLPAHEAFRTAMVTLPEAFTPGHQFVRFYVRLHTPSYRINQSPGFQTKASKEAFEKLSIELAGHVGLGTKVRHYWANEAKDEYIYAHPDHFSGIVSIERLNALLDALPGYTDFFTLRGVDIYQMPERINDDEKRLRLNHYRVDLARHILTRFTTGKKAKFLAPRQDLVIDTLSRFRGLEFIDHCGLEPSICPTSEQFMTSLLDDLINQGLLHERTSTLQGGLHSWRSSLKSELRAIPKSRQGEFYPLSENLLWPKSLTM